MEAVQIKLTGSIASSYDVYYRVHSQTFGWLDWACNGQSAGSAGYAKRIEAIQIVLVKKGGAAPGSTATPYKEAPPSVTYQTYISGGWQPAAADKATSGLAGQGKKTEGLRVSLKAGAQSLGNSSVKYRTYLQTYGWQSWVSNGASSAKAGSGKRMEAIEISLTGDISLSMIFITGPTLPDMAGLAGPAMVRRPERPIMPSRLRRYRRCW